MAPDRKQTLAYKGFAIPLQPDTDLGLGNVVPPACQSNPPQGAAETPCYSR